MKWKCENCGTDRACLLDIIGCEGEPDGCVLIYEGSASAHWKRQEASEHD
jgi:hypothetical protein